MDVEKIMAKERERVEKERAEEEKRVAKSNERRSRENAELQGAWESIRDTVRTIPGVAIDEDARRAMGVGGWIGIEYDTHLVVYPARSDMAEVFKAKDWKKALETFVRNTARRSA